MKKIKFKRLNSIILVLMMVFLQFSGLEFRWQPASVKAAGIGAGKTILFDNAHAQVAGSANWRITTDFKAFADDLKKLDYTVLENNSVFSDSVLASADVLVIPEANKPFTTEEKQALIRFVESGKGIYFISDHTGSDRNNDGWDSTEVFNGYLDGQARTTENELLNKFGFECLKNTVWQSPITDIRESWVSPKGDFTKGIGAWAGCTFKITDPAKAQAVAILTTNGPTDSTPDFQKWLTAEKGGEAEGAYVVVSKPNKGKVAAIGDSSPVEENSKYHGWTDTRYEDAKISLNIVNWLATTDNTVGIPADRQTPNVGNADGSSNTGGTNPPQTAAYQWNNTIPEKKPNDGAKNNGKLVLFDNSHQNTAGQADWVIDGGFSDFADALVKEGFTVKEYRGIDKDGDGSIRFFDDRKLKVEEEGTAVDKNESIITYDAIKNADVFITAESNRPLRKSEQDALKKFMDDGKGVYFIADHYNADRNCNTWDSDEVYNGYNRYDDASYNMTGTVYGDLRNPKDGSKGWLAENFGVRFRFNAIDYKSGLTGIKPESESEGLTKGIKPILMAAGSTLSIVDNNKAKGIVYFSNSDKPAKWGSAVDKGLYFGGEAEGAFVAISKPSKGRAAFLGDSSPVEDATGKYKNEKDGSAKSLHAGWTSAGNAAQLSINIVNWLADSSVSYVGFGASDHPKGVLTPTLMASEEMTDPDKGVPWSNPTYDPWNTDTYASGAYGAPNGSSGGSTGGGGTTPPSGSPTLTLAPMYVYGKEPFAVIIGGDVTDPEFGIYFKTGGNQVGAVKSGTTWSAGNAYAKVIGKTPMAITAKATKLPTDNLLAIKARVAGSSTKYEKRDATAISSGYGFISGMVPGDVGDVVAILDGEDVIGTAQVEAGGNVRIASRTGEGYNLVLYGKDGSVKSELQGEYSVKAGETTNIVSKVDVASVSLDTTSKRLKVGESFGLTASVLPENATNKNVIWSSSDEKVVKVEDGKLTAVALGKATITVKTEDGNFTATCSVEVVSNGLTINITANETDNSLNVSIDNFIIIDDIITVKVKDKITSEIKALDQYNLVNGIALFSVQLEPGKYTASFKSLSGEEIDRDFTLNYKMAASVALNKSELSLKTGESEILSAIVKDVNGSKATYQNINWTSSKESVATVDQDGKVTAVTPGEAIITATSLDGKIASACSIKITQPVTSIKLDKHSLDLNVGDSSNLTAVINPENASNKALVWKTSDESIAKVDINGKVTAMGIGKATITAASVDGNKTDSCTVNVNSRVIAVTGVKVEPTSKRLKVGESFGLTASVLPENATNKNVIWSSSDEKVVKVENGKLTAVALGKATITVRTEDENFIATCSVEVVSNGLTINITANETDNSLIVSINNFIIIDDIITVKVKDKITGEIKALDKYNLVNGIALFSIQLEPGKYTANFKSLSGEEIDRDFTLNYKMATSVALNKSELSLKTGESEILSAIVKDVNGSKSTYQNINWTSSKESVATVDQDGKVTAVTPGEAIITATSLDGKIASACSIKITQPVTSIKLDKHSLDLNVGESSNLTAVINPENASNKALVWKTSDESIAKVDNNGKVTAIGVGKATITAASVDGNKTDSCTVNVKPRVIAVTGVKVEPSSIELKVGDTAALKAIVEPIDAANRAVQWNSDNEAIATVDFKGNITAISSGETTITATTVDGEFKASCKVVVIRTAEVTNSPEVINNIIKDTNVKEIKVIITDKTIIDKSIFETLKAEADKGNYKVITFEIKNDKVEMTWSFNSRDIKDSANIKAIDLSLMEVQKDVRDYVNKIDKDALVISFAPNGILPAPATVRIKVPGNIDTTKDIFFYYINPDTKALAEKQGPLTAKGGYVTVTLKHCSEYVLTGVNIDVNNGNSSSGNGSTNNQGTNAGNNNSTSNNTQNSMPKTGSPVDMTSLVILGVLIISVGVYIIIRKTKKS